MSAIAIQHLSADQIPVNTVRRHLEQPDLPRYTKCRSVRPKLGSFEAYLREPIAAAGSKRIPAPVLAREIRERHYGSTDRKGLRLGWELRPRPAEEPLVRFETAVRERMQVDWIELVTKITLPGMDDLQPPT
jgi:transposase